MALTATALSSSSVRTRIPGSRCRRRIIKHEFARTGNPREGDHGPTSARRARQVRDAVRRAGVTVALNLLEDRGLVRGQRGMVVILDRQGLLAMTNGFYGGLVRGQRGMVVILDRQGLLAMTNGFYGGL